ncbi:hypothetical protein C7405_106196 [Paraburkholderia caballeronis]|uniref:carboxypeptidase-like regulatory domain-containing protein n=1 Tax=Paraburkholderia caballeronis TaxID=416943 RepID=UPI001065003D|nr:carboxypeptidase-like regulatory domain-containing protein [Paraburkholderia caballeronis]TDV35164.1 hypothetical protein C7405_106196 [Paraburkholderia caballeronis]
MEKQRNSHRIVSMLIAAAVAGGVAGGAAAQTDAGGTVGGTTTDNTSVGNIHPTGMPQTEQQGDVSFVSGGVGLDESTALRRAQSQWPLSLRFTGPSSAYVANVHVQIVDAGGKTVLDTASKGPYMLVRLHPGRYTIHATYSDVARSQTVTVRGNGSARATFAWQVSR